MRKADLSLVIRQPWAVRDRGVAMRVRTREGALRFGAVARRLPQKIRHSTFKGQQLQSKRSDKEATKVQYSHLQWTVRVTSILFDCTRNRYRAEQSLCVNTGERIDLKRCLYSNEC